MSPDVGLVIEWLLGLNADQLAVEQVVVRALVVYVAALVMVRLGEKRFIGKNTAFDVILGIILGSVVSRAITGNAPFFPTLLGGAALVALHWLFSAVAFRFSWFGFLIKGRPKLLIEQGELQTHNLQSSHITQADLLSAVRLQGQTADLSQIETAYFEPNGNISVLATKRESLVIDIQVRDGVQTVRIQLE